MIVGLVRRLGAGFILGSLLTGASALAAVAAPPTPPAPPASPDYYEPPHLLKQGTATSPISGNGTVVIQVLVNPDGTFKVQKVVKSTNKALEPVALEMAGSAKYAPATKGKKKIVAFYTYTLKFVGNSASSSDPATSGQMATFTNQIRSGKYADAKAGLTAYLEAHPSDVPAATMLGVADTFLDDYSGAAAAFDKVQKIPSQYVPVAARAYGGAAEKALGAKDGAAAMAAAKRAYELSPGVATLNVLGTAQYMSKDYTSAAKSFEDARTQAAASGKFEPKQLATITSNLVSTYVDAGDIDKAVGLLPDIKKYDASNTAGESYVVNYYLTKAKDAQAAKNLPQAAAIYDKAAQVGPTYAVVMYTNEASTLYQVTPKPDYKAVKAAADKALAIAPGDGGANLIAAYALVSDGKAADAKPYIDKADAAAKSTGDKALADRVAQLTKQLGGAK